MCAVDLVEQNRRDLFQNLYSERGAFNDIDTADKRVDDKRGLGRVVDADGVAFALDSQGKALAFSYQDGLVDLYFDLDRTRRRVEILNYPLITVQFLLRWLLRP